MAVLPVRAMVRPRPHLPLGRSRHAENSKLLVSWLEKSGPGSAGGAFVCTGLSPRVVSLTEDLDHDGLSRAVEVVDARDLEHRPACITQPCSVHDEVDCRGHLRAHMSDGRSTSDISAIVSRRQSA